MKILVAHERYQQRGGEDAVFEVEAQLLRERGADVIEYVEDNARIKEMARLLLVRDTVWSQSSKARIKDVLRRGRVEVAHFHNTFPLISPAAYFACREAGAAVVQTLHNYRVACPAAIFFRSGRVCEDCLGRALPWPGVVHGCYRKSRAASGAVAAMLAVHRLLGTWRRRVDVYVALSEFAKKKFVESGLPEERIVVKPNFVAPDPGRKRGLGDFALFLGRLSPEKGIDVLLRAWGGLRGVRLCVAGGGPLLDRVREVAARWASVEVLGGVGRARAIELLGRARFVVVPSACYENCPAVILEAFARGVPVVASRLGAMAEMIDDGRTGLLFAPGSAEDLAAKAVSLWERTAAAERMGGEARAEYESKYTAERNYEMLMETYRVAIRRAPAASGSARNFQDHRG